MSWDRYRRTLNRRTILRGLGTSAAGLFLSPMLGRVDAQASGAPAAQRLVIIKKGNGFHRVFNYRKTENQVLDEPIASGWLDNMPHVYSWESVRDRVVYVDGLANKMGAGQVAGHRAKYYALTCRPYLGSNGPSGESIDEYIAQRRNDNVVFPVLRLGAEGGNRGLDFAGSAAALGSPLPSQNDPSEAYRELFGVASEDPDLRAAFEEKGLLMTAIREEARRAEQSLVGEEKWKLQRYLFSIDTFQQQHAQLTQLGDYLETCKPNAPVVEELDNGTALEKMAPIAASALICGLTNIVVMNVGDLDQFGRYGAWGFGGGHSMGH
ncbi:MAG: DUF1552 domain-containing protein, partial [Myxococcota bacterium]